MGACNDVSCFRRELGFSTCCTLNVCSGDTHTRTQTPREEDSPIRLKRKGACKQAFPRQECDERECNDFLPGNFGGPGLNGSASLSPSLSFFSPSGTQHIQYRVVLGGGAIVAALFTGRARGSARKCIFLRTHPPAYVLAHAPYNRRLNRWWSSPAVLF